MSFRSSVVSCTAMLFLAVFVASLSAAVFDPSPSASTGAIAEGTGNAYYGNFGLNADGLNPPANTYNVFRKFQGVEGLAPPDNETQLLIPDEVNNTSATWEGLNQGGDPGTGAGFGTGFKAPGMFIGSTPSASSYEDQLLNFGPVIDIGALPGNFNGDSSFRRQWELRVGFLEDPESFIAANAPNDGTWDTWDGDWRSDGVSINVFIGSNDEGDVITGSSNWFAHSQIPDAAVNPDDVGFYMQSGLPNTAIADEPGRDNYPLTLSRVKSGIEIDDLATNTDLGVPYEGRPEISWNLELNNPDAEPGTLEAREVRFSAKVGNLIYDGVFDPGDAANPVIPNPTNDPDLPFTDGFFDWQNATPVFYLGAHNETAPGAFGIQGVFYAGDFNANGTVDEIDLAAWEGNKYTIDTMYARGDGDQDGDTDVDDLIVWNGTKNTSADGIPGNDVPDFYYDPATGELSVDGDGADVHAFTIDLDPSNIISVTSDNLPGAGQCDAVNCWDIREFDGAIQTNDTTITEANGPLHTLAGDGSGRHVIAMLQPGLSLDDFGEANYGTDTMGNGRTPISESGGVTLMCDFDGDGVCNGADIDALMNEVAAGTNAPAFDLNNDNVVDDLDRDEWLGEAGPANGLAGSYLLGDANLDGSANSQDLNALALTWQTDNNDWTHGNFTGGGTNAADLNELGLNWQNSVPLAAAAAVPEPACFALLATALLCSGYFRRRQDCAAC